MQIRAIFNQIIVDHIRIIRILAAHPLMSLVNFEWKVKLSRGATVALLPPPWLTSGVGVASTKGVAILCLIAEKF